MCPKETDKNNRRPEQAVDAFYMRRCLQLAANGRQLSRPNPMVGAVIVADGRIIGEGYHVRCGEGHAEVNAFRSVSPADAPLLSRSTIYVSLEPCAHFGKTPPCCDLIIDKGVSRVVVGCVDTFSQVQGRGISRIRQAGIPVTVGVLEQECRWLNRRFFTFHQHQRPYIILKWAQTSDRYLDSEGQPMAISPPLTRMLMHRLRAEEDAIVVGRVTDEREHPLLTVRDWHGRNPVRFVLSRNHCNLDHIMAQCREQQLQSLVVEGGLKTLQSFLDRDLWDELRVETAPLLAGHGTPAPPLPASLQLLSAQQIDGNTICRYVRRDHDEATDSHGYPSTTAPLQP